MSVSRRWEREAIEERTQEVMAELKGKVSALVVHRTVGTTRRMSRQRRAIAIWSRFPTNSVTNTDGDNPSDVVTRGERGW